MNRITPVSRVGSPSSVKPVTYRAPSIDFCEDVAPVLVLCLLVVAFAILAGVS